MSISNPVKPYSFVNGAGNKVDAPQVNADFDTIYTKVNEVITALNGVTATSVQTQIFGNADGDVPISNGTICTNLNADKLDNQHGSFYQDASNLNAGTIPLARIPATLTGKDADTLDTFHASATPSANTIPVLDSSSRLVWAAKPAIKRCLAYKDTDLTYVNWYNAGTENRLLEFNQEAYDDASIHSVLSNPSRFTVPANTSKIRMSVQIGLVSSGGGCSNSFIRILKNGSVFNLNYFQGETALVNIQHATAWTYAVNESGGRVDLTWGDIIYKFNPDITIDVSPNDYFEVQLGVIGGTFGYNIAKNNTYFYMEIVE